jgi:hypothetical protein
LTQVQASDGNFMFYTVNTTGSDKGYPTSCFDTIRQHSLTARDHVSLSAEVGKDDAVMRFNFVEANTGYSVKGEFNGK